MAEQHVYLALQRLNLPSAYWQDLKSALADKARNRIVMPGLEPKDYWHTVTSLDGTIIIGDTTFEAESINPESFTAWLAATFGVDLGMIGEDTGYNAYGRFSTFSYGAQDRFRLGVFGFVAGEGWPTVQQSRQTARQYVTDHLVEWEI